VAFFDINQQFCVYNQSEESGYMDHQTSLDLKETSNPLSPTPAYVSGFLA